MPRRELSMIVDVPAASAFDFIHDYSHRLEWDSLLRAAYVVGPGAEPGVGVRTMCIAKRRHGGLKMLTEYVAFEPGKVSAVRLCKSNLLFTEFAATIRHRPEPAGRSEVRYIYNFRSRAGRAGDAIVDRLLAIETRQRLEALRQALGQR